ncbi:MAG: MgtC/SapB family protein [Phycisphaerae bacterium]|jgi:putative Mg2+ transporter-C (MgtC) family protein|nr:MgtC/SapB family protein [Phycisphaerae bacterium]
MIASVDWFGDLYKVLPVPVCGAVLVSCAILCGVLIGLEREHRAKPAGVKTVSLICIGSTIFTIASILIAGESGADRGRIAAQVVTGIGFLGAGAIIRDHKTIIGLTTGATIWVVSAIGVLIGAGYAAGGVAMTLLVLGLLLVLRHSEQYLKRKAEKSTPASCQSDEETCEKRA